MWRKGEPSRLKRKQNRRQRYMRRTWGKGGLVWCGLYTGLHNLKNQDEMPEMPKEKSILHRATTAVLRVF